MAELPDRTFVDAVDVLPEDLELEPFESFVELGSGFNSRALRVGDMVFKVGKRATSWDEAQELAGTMESEHDLIAGYVGDSMPLTTFSVVESVSKSHRYRVVTEQDFVPGKTLREFLNQPDKNTRTLQRFLLLCMDMHDDTRMIPDLANVEGGFSVIRTGNLVVQGEKPILVDTTFGKMQRSRVLGRFINQRIRMGVERMFEPMFLRTQLEDFRG